jgi:hypothetical protein
MRIGFPERVSPAGAFVFAAASFGIQQVQHTSVLFSALYFAFVILSMVAFNVAGGFSRVAGAYYCWFSLLVCIVGVTWKMVINEPGESNLQVPTLTMTCYVVCASMFIVVAFILRKVDLRHYEFGAGGRTRGLNYTAAGLGCILLALANTLLDYFVGATPGGLLSALRQLDQFLPLGIMLATIGAINDSKGKRTVSLVSLFGMGMMFLLGLIVFSKQGMLTPMVCWIIAMLYKRFDFRRPQVIAIIIGTFLSLYVFTPLSQARDLVTDQMTYGEKLVVAVDAMIHIQRTRQHVSDEVAGAAPSHSYFSGAQNGLIQRLNMIGVDDALINVGDTATPLGLQPVADDFLNFVPHAITPNKRDPLTGNHYGHEIGGMLADDDFGTGISFSPVAETFRLDRWLGLVFILPGVWLILFSSVEFICGNAKTSPWSLLPILMYAHVAPEGLLSGQIYLIGFGNAGILLAILVSTRLAPTLGKLFYGSAIAGTTIAEGAGSTRRGTPPSGAQAAVALP